MSEPNVPPPSKAPAKAAKGIVGSLKGHPPWLYAVVIAGAIAAAYYIRQRQAANAAALSGVDDAPTAVDGYASADYDTSAYPGATQGSSYWGQSQPGDEAASTADPVDQFGAILGLFQQFQQMAQPVGGGGGGAPTLAPDTHYTPTPVVEAPYVPPVVTPPPASPATQRAPVATTSGPQPNSAPGVFYNPDRKLRYIVQATKGKNYRRYESKLNKGDWGQGGVIPQ